MSMCASNLYQKLCLGSAYCLKDKKRNSFSDRKPQSKCKGAAAVNKQLKLNKGVQQLGEASWEKEQCEEQ